MQSIKINFLSFFSFYLYFISLLFPSNQTQFLTFYLKENIELFIKTYLILTEKQNFFYKIIVLNENI